MTKGVTRSTSRRSFAGLALFALSAVRSAQAAHGARPADFRLRAVSSTTWKGVFRLGEHLGKRPVVLAFFATWCRPCEVELPVLQRVRARHPETALAIAAISVDGPETAAQIGVMARRLKLAFPVLHDADSTVASRLNPQRQVPFLVVVDRQGRIVRERSGFTPAEEKALPGEIEALVAAP